MQQTACFHIGAPILHYCCTNLAMSTASSATEGANASSIPAAGFQGAAFNSSPVTGFGSGTYSSSPLFGFGSATHSSSPASGFGSTVLNSGQPHQWPPPLFGDAASSSSAPAFGTPGWSFGSVASSSSSSSCASGFGSGTYSSSPLFGFGSAIHSSSPASGFGRTAFSSGTAPFGSAASSSSTPAFGTPQRYAQGFPEEMRWAFMQSSAGAPAFGANPSQPDSSSAFGANPSQADSAPASGTSASRPASGPASDASPFGPASSPAPKPSSFGSATYRNAGHSQHPLPAKPFVNMFTQTLPHAAPRLTSLATAGSYACKCQEYMTEESAQRPLTFGWLKTQSQAAQAQFGIVTWLVH